MQSEEEEKKNNEKKKERKSKIKPRKLETSAADCLRTKHRTK